MTANMLIIHGGAPTAVINSSLYGAITEARRHAAIGRILGARLGSAGVLREDFIDLSAIPDRSLELLLQTPASAIGTSRDHLEPEDYDRMAVIFEKHNIRYVLINGGNGSMDTCGKISRACEGKGISVVGIPKTIDNDIAVTDHAPGYGSAARFIAATVAEIAADVKAMPIHVCVIEAMGRNAGWITAASALARRAEGDAPHLIYLPERVFDEERFLADVLSWHKKLGGGVVVVCSEGLKNQAGEPIVPPIFRSGRSVYYGDTGAYLAELVIKRLGIKARSEKPGISGRASIAWQSPVDQAEAVIAGETAVRACLAGQTAVMVGFVRRPGKDFACDTTLISVEDVMLHEKIVPDAFINDAGNNVTAAFVAWCRPLIGGDLPLHVSFIG